MRFSVWFFGANLRRAGCVVRLRASPSGERVISPTGSRSTPKSEHVESLETDWRTTWRSLEANTLGKEADEREKSALTGRRPTLRENETGHTYMVVFETTPFTTSNARLAGALEHCMTVAHLNAKWSMFSFSFSVFSCVRFSVCFFGGFARCAAWVPGALARLPQRKRSLAYWRPTQPESGLAHYAPEPRG